MTQEPWRIYELIGQGGLKGTIDHMITSLIDHEFHGGNLSTARQAVPEAI